MRARQLVTRRPAAQRSTHVRTENQTPRAVGSRVILDSRPDSYIMTLAQRKPHFGLLLLTSFALFISACVLDQAVRWSNPFEGALNGVLQTVFTGFAWLFFILPLSLGIYGLYRWRRWERHRIIAILAPSLACHLLVLAGFVFDPPTPSHRLHRFTGAQLPSTGHNFRTHFTGGGLADVLDTYYFRCSAAETDRLISELGLKIADQYDQDKFATAPFPDWPQPSDWVGKRVYRGGREHWFYYLATDAAREQVYLLVGCL